MLTAGPEAILTRSASDTMGFSAFQAVFVRHAGCFRRVFSTAVGHQVANSDCRGIRSRQFFGRLLPRNIAMSETNGTHRQVINRIADSQDALFEEGRSERVRILIASHRAEACLTAPAPAREPQWRDQVYQSLNLLRASLREASQRGESAGGLIADLKSTSDKYYHRVSRLQQEFDEMIRRCDATIEHLRSQGDEESIDYADIRQRVTWLLTSLKHHQAREADLVFEAYGLDIGIGD